MSYSLPPSPPEDIFEDMPPPEGDDPVLEVFGPYARSRGSALPVPVEESIIESFVPDGEPPILESLVVPTRPAYNATRRPLTPHEWNQRVIVYAVMLLLTLVVLTICVAWVIRPDVDLNTISTVVLVPLIAFAGPFMGFYFRG